MTDPTEPEVTIGPYYKVLGFGCALVGAVLAVLPKIRGTPYDKSDLYMVGAFLAVALVLIRPKPADDMFKFVIAKLPFTKFTGDPK